MIVLEYKLYGRDEQFVAVNEAIRTMQFIRNKCLRLWVDGGREGKVGKYDLSAHTAVLAREFAFANKLNSMARQGAAERAWAAISRFYENVRSGKAGKKGYPRFQHDNRSVEYKTTGWKLSGDGKRITFTDGHQIGCLKIKGTRDLALVAHAAIKRVRVVRKADGYYAQFAVKVDRVEEIPPSGTTVGLDVGLKEFYTDSNGTAEPNPRFLRQGEQALKRAQRRVSRRVRGSNNRRKAINKLGRQHLKIQRKRKDHAIKLARCVVRHSDLVAVEDLQVSNLVRNHHLARSISDASWSQFRSWLEYFGKVYGKVAVPAPAHYTSVNCSGCGAAVKKALSTRTHRCPKCGLVLDRDHNAALNILERGLRIAGHARTVVGSDENAWGEEGLCEVDGNVSHASHLVEPGIPPLKGWECQPSSQEHRSQSPRQDEELRG